MKYFTRLLCATILLAPMALKAQKMFLYKDAKGKTLSQAQVDELDKKYQGFLSMEIVEEGSPMVVQVSAPSPEELKSIQKIRLQETEALKQKWLGKSLPAFKLETLQDKELLPKNLIGHPTLLYFWSRNDYSSINQIAALNQLAAAFKGKPLQFWALTFEDRVLVKEFLQQHPFNFVHAPGDFEFVMEKMGIMQTPVVLLLDSKGVVRYLSTSTQKNIDVLLRAELAKIK